MPILALGDGPAVLGRSGFSLVSCRSIQYRAEAEAEAEAEEVEVEAVVVAVFRVVP